MDTINVKECSNNLGCLSMVCVPSKYFGKLVVTCNVNVDYIINSSNICMWIVTFMFFMFSKVYIRPFC